MRCTDSRNPRSACSGARPGEPVAIPLDAIGRSAARGNDPPALLIGLDVGSTTVKALVVDAASDAIVWQRYERHASRQAERAAAQLEAIEAAFPRAPMRLFVTGSGGAALIPHIGGKFVQEVNAVALAVEKLHPEVMSVVELGGQDAKIIVFKESETGKRKIPSMNDKCAGGTGAVIDKIAAKLKIAPEDVGGMAYEGLALHPVAGKCGVFAETDINSLQKQGVPADELMASLFEAIVQQNLSVLARGHTLRPTVLLLGGPNRFIRGLRECWRRHLPRIWQERNVALPDPTRSATDYVLTPENAEYFAAFGAIEFGRAELRDDCAAGGFAGAAALRHGVGRARSAPRTPAAASGLSANPEELAAFKARYRPEPWAPARFAAGERVAAFVGLDGGSTSTKGVLLGADGRVLTKAYLLSKGNPIEDAQEIVARLASAVTAQGARLQVLGLGTTGYAKDLLKDVLGADVAVVETVAHAQACLHDYPGAEVVVDLGGQDIKLIILKDGRVKDFKLNTQCSAGNGYFLQATARALGVEIEDYAEVAFSARAMPEFGYGCAVFLQSDIVDFQRQGWSREEILAGLAAVLPKNIWFYVAQMPNVARLGRRFVLQGGTQRNLAAVKAQVDFLRARFRGTDLEPDVLVHRHCGESGAIGAALEASRCQAEGRSSAFIGIEAVAAIRYRARHGEDTRCEFCKNRCVRTFIDVYAEATARTAGGQRRLIVASCEKGAVEDLDAMRHIKAGLDEVMARSPNLVAYAARSVFREVPVPRIADPLPAAFNLPARRRRAAMERREKLRIGFPRVLNLYAHAPFFIAYFTALGVPYRGLAFSDTTSPELYRRGARRGSIDPCFPSKLGIAHVHDLLYRVHEKRQLTHIFFPMVDTMPSALQGTRGAYACPAAVATAEATHAAFIKEGDLFAERGIMFKKTFLNLDEPELCARQLFEDWKDEPGLSYAESLRAVRAGLAALEAHDADLRCRGREVLERLEREERLGILVLGRPYHNDPGINHEILETLQKRGYPILCQDALPRDSDILQRLFGAEVRAGLVSSALAIDDVWKNSYSEHTSRKLWAAKCAARHPNLVALELSSFKCGHDAPIYTAIERIVERSGTPYFSFKDIDENRPAASIKIRIETIVYFLERYAAQTLGGRNRARAA